MMGVSSRKGKYSESDHCTQQVNPVLENNYKCFILYMSGITLFHLHRKVTSEFQNEEMAFWTSLKFFTECFKTIFRALI